MLTTIVQKCQGKYQMDQTMSIMTSILGLAWTFTSYHSILKRGALEKDLAAVFYRIVLFLSNLFQITGRMFILVLFAFSFRTDEQHQLFWPLLLFLAIHILVMSVLHFIFSDATTYWKESGCTKLSFFHYMIGNGLANVYIHNWIRMDPLLKPGTKPRQHVSTLVRQVVFDLVFFVENVLLLVYAIHCENPVREVVNSKAEFIGVLLGFIFLGLILKWVYYQYIHIWGWLILTNDYQTKSENGHWQCFTFSNMFLCGELREAQKLILCCLPKPIPAMLSCIFGEKPYLKQCGSWFNMILVILLFPLLLVVAALALVLILAMMLIFLPIFLVFLLPCVIMKNCKEKIEDKRLEDFQGDLEMNQIVDPLI